MGPVWGGRNSFGGGGGVDYAALAAADSDDEGDRGRRSSFKGDDRRRRPDDLGAGSHYGPAAAGSDWAGRDRARMMGSRDRDVDYAERLRGGSDRHSFGDDRRASMGSRPYTSTSMGEHT